MEAKEKTSKEKKSKEPKLAPPSQISFTSDGDFLVIRMPRKLAIKQLLN